MSESRYILSNTKKDGQYIYHKQGARRQVPKGQRPTTRLKRTGVQVKAKANSVEDVNKPMVQTDGAANKGRRQCT